MGVKWGEYTEPCGDQNLSINGKPRSHGLLIRPKKTGKIEIDYFSEAGKKDLSKSMQRSGVPCFTPVLDSFSIQVKGGAVLPEECGGLGTLLLLLMGARKGNGIHECGGGFTLSESRKGYFWMSKHTLT